MATSVKADRIDTRKSHRSGQYQARQQRYVRQRQDLQGGGQRRLLSLSGMYQQRKHSLPHRMVVSQSGQA